MTDEIQNNENENKLFNQAELDEIVKKRLAREKNASEERLEQERQEKEQLRRQLEELQKIQMVNSQPHNNEDAEQGMKNQDNISQVSYPDNIATKDDMQNLLSQHQEQMKLANHADRIKNMVQRDPKFQSTLEEFSKKGKQIPLQVERDLMDNLPEEEAKKIFHRLMTNDNDFNNMHYHLTTSLLNDDSKLYSDWVKSQLNQTPYVSQSNNEGPDLRETGEMPEIDKADIARSYWNNKG